VVAAGNDLDAIPLADKRYDAHPAELETRNYE
jgi:hypothetical protein